MNHGPGQEIAIKGGSFADKDLMTMVDDNQAAGNVHGLIQVGTQDEDRGAPFRQPQQALP
jgi:hypothetical protein